MGFLSHSTQLANQCQKSGSIFFCEWLIFIKRFHPYGSIYDWCKLAKIFKHFSAF